MHYVKKKDSSFYLHKAINFFSLLGEIVLVAAAFADINSLKKEHHTAKNHLVLGS